MSKWPDALSMERHQILLYLVAIGLGSVFGFLVPAGKPILEVAINPLIGALLYVTFLSLPLTKLRASIKNRKFLGLLTLVNFVLVPIVAYLLSRSIQDHQALLIGLLLVLLAPCVDYVIVFTNIAGGASHQLLAATPLLMLLQMILLPVFLYFFTGAAVTSMFSPRPFVTALLGLIVLPLVAAVFTRLLVQRFAQVRKIFSIANWSMVPLMMATLSAVVGSQIPVVLAELQIALRVLPLLISFAALMLILGSLVAKAADLDAPEGRALVFSGITRNSLVVLPIALALPRSFALAPAVVVMQTLVELLCMLVLIKVVPKILPVKKSPVV